MQCETAPVGVDLVEMAAIAAWEETPGAGGSTESCGCQCTITGAPDTLRLCDWCRDLLLVLAAV